MAGQPILAKTASLRPSRHGTVWMPGSVMLSGALSVAYVA